MGVVDRLRGRKATEVVDDLGPVENTNEKSTDADELARANQEAEVHPDEVTKEAQFGLQKAEAVTLVWGKKAVYATYAW